MSDQQLPYTEPNEQALLGAAIQNAERVMPVLSELGVTDEWFFAPRHRLIWAAVLGLHESGKGVDELTVETYMLADCTLDMVGGNGYLATCTDACITTAHAEHYADEVHKAYVGRQWIAIAAHADELAREPAGTTADMLARIAEYGQSIGDLATADTRATVGAATVAREVMAEWVADVPPERFCHWPIMCMDRHIGRLSGDLVFIAASTSVGKTAFACQMAATNAKWGIPCSYWTGESSAHRVVKRFISHMGQVSTINLNQHRATDEDRAKAARAATGLKSLPIRICDAGMTIDELVTWGKVEVQRGARMLYVDNTRHIRDGRQRHKSPVEEFRYNSIRLQHLQKDTGVPVIALHHLTEDGNMSWSRDLERDADVLLALVELR